MKFLETENALESRLLKKLRETCSSGVWYVAFKYREDTVPHISFASFFNDLKKLRKEKVVETKVQATAEYGTCTCFRLRNSSEDSEAV